MSLTLVQTNVSVVEDQGRVELTIVKEGTATISVNVSIAGQAAEAQRESYMNDTLYC